MLSRERQLLAERTAARKPPPTLDLSSLAAAHGTTEFGEALPVPKVVKASKSFDILGRGVSGVSVVCAAPTLALHFLVLFFFGL